MKKKWNSMSQEEKDKYKQDWQELQDRFKTAREEARAVTESKLKAKADWWNNLSDEEKEAKKEEWKNTDWEKKASNLADKLKEKFNKIKDDVKGDE